VRGFAEYTTSCILIIAIIGAIAWIFTDRDGQHAVLVSAGLAFVVQLVGFSMARRFRRRNLLLGWGIGSVLRLIALVLYAVVIARLWRAPIGPALLSFVAFLFVTTVVEPIFLRR
jgi:hypothetical protein